MFSKRYIHCIKQKIHLLQPYPHIARTILGSGLASLLTALIICTGYISYKAVSATMTFFQPKTLCTTKQNIPQKRLPLPEIKKGQSHRESFLYTAFPYHEKITTPLTDGARQADFALIQTLVRLSIDKDRLYLLTSEYRRSNNETYHFQRIKLFIPNEIEFFITMLQENIEAWAENVKISTLKDKSSVYTLSTNGITTHELILVPAGDEFIVSPLDENPRMTIVIDDLGENIDIATTLISFEIPITLSILPYSNYAKAVAMAAHNAGREILIHQPMEAMQSPYVSAGPEELTINMSQKEIAKILYKNITNVPYASGINNHMGSRFTCNEKSNRIVCDILTSTGLFVLDSLTHSKSSFYTVAQKKGLPAYCRTIFLDHEVHSQKSILENLKKAEKKAIQTGNAIVIGHPYPETIAALKKWMLIRDKSIHIVPLRYQTIIVETLKPESTPQG